jgi:thiamine-monophosphate kinase
MDTNNENKQKRTEISSLGEFGLIDHLSRNAILRNKSSIKGIGDDAAVIACDKKHSKVITTDLMLEGIHFDLSYHPLKHLGYKAVVINLSDVYAMNAIPEQITVSIGVSNRFPVEALEELYEGIYAACEHYGVDLIGGDTSSSLKGLIISITAVGYAETSSITYRNGAKNGDLIVVSGDLGGAYLGLQILEREKTLFAENPEIKPDLEGEKYIIGRQLKPEARKDVIDILEETGIKPNSMIDISDGLSSDLLHICNQSGLGCMLYEDHIPIAEETKRRAMKFNMASSTAALNGGEDYELLFTIDAKDKETVEKFPDFTLIGYMTKLSNGFKLKTNSGSVHDLTAQGWGHF